MRPAHGFFPAFHGGCARRGKKQTGHETANNRAVKSFIVGEISQDRISATSGHRQLHRTFTQPFLQFVKIQIEPATRIADDNDRFGFTRRRVMVQRSSLSFRVGP